MNNDTIISGEAGPTSARRIRDEGSQAAVTHYVDTRWPPIGGEDLEPLPESAFADPEFADAYRPGQLTYVYVAGSGETLMAAEHPTGLHGLAQRFRLPLFKISATSSDNPMDRIEDINIERYAGVYLRRAFAISVRDGALYMEQTRVSCANGG